MQLENVHALINVEPVIDIFHEGADHRGQEANDGGEPDADITRGGCDTHESGNGSLAGTDDAKPTLVLEVIDGDLDDTRVSEIFQIWECMITDPSNGAS